MIMLLTHRRELREQLSKVLQESGHRVAIPPHREDMLAVLQNSHPRLIILDLYLSDPNGAEDLKLLRDHGYEGTIIVLSGPSMMSVLKDAYASKVESIVLVPVQTNGHLDLGDLQATINACLKGDSREKQEKHHTLIAQRAYALYEANGRRDGRDVQDWLQAERDVGM
jgi:DNA-binding response OmpR family regulator